MILVLGGTSDSLVICDKLNEQNIKYCVSVTTEYGKKLAQKHCNNVLMKKFTQEELVDFIKGNKVDKIIDSTHPYAIEVSNNAIACAKNLDIDYIRYERKSLLKDIKYENIHIVKNISEACKVASKIGNTIFIGTGSKNLDKYIDALPNKKLIARVLPTSEVIVACETLGLTADNIIAMKGPFTEKINEETYKQYNIDTIITKESGIEGGFLEKINACEALNIPAIIIARDELDYPNVINDIKKLDKLI